MRLGLIGSGFISKFHLLALRQVKGWTVSGMLDRRGSPELVELARREGLGDPKIYPSITELVRNCDVPAIFSPNYTRVEAMEEIAAAAAAGAPLKGLICEKPLGRNLAEARRLVELAEDLKAPTAYFENQLFMKCVQVQMRQLRKVQEEMGPPLLARSSEEHAGPHAAWFWDPRKQGGGVLCDMGCHGISVGWYLLTPLGRAPDFLQPESVSAEVALLKWGLPRWRNKLLAEQGVDYSRHPAEDFTTGVVTYRNPETGRRVKGQFTSSWMFEKQGLRLLMDGMGPGYAFEINSLLSPLTIFIGDEAAEAVADPEAALEKATAGRGLLAVQYNEPDLYGYTDVFADAYEAFSEGRDALLPWSYGLAITRLVMAAYLAAERRRTVDLTDPATLQDLETYRPAIQQGLGADQLL